MNKIDLTQPEHSFRPWIVCFVAALFFFYEFFQMNMLNAISQALMQTFNLTTTEFGKLSAYYFYANIIFLLPAGQILDRVSTRKVILTALTICVLATITFALAPNIAVAKIARFSAGIGSAFCFLSCVRLASRWFPAQRLALVTGLAVTMAMLGGMTAQTPLTLLTHHFDWRHAILIDAVVGVFFLLLIFILVKDYPPNYQAEHKSQQQQLLQLGYWKSLRLSYLNIQNWLCGIYTCLLNLPIFVLGGFLGNQYLVYVHHLDYTRASVVSSMLFLGTVFGSPTMGWLSDRIGLRRLPMIVGAIVSLVLILLIMLLPDLNFSSLLILFLALGFVTSTQVVSYPTVAENNSKLLTATSVSVVSLSVISGGAIFDPFFGWLIDLHAKTLGHFAPNYTTSDFQFAIRLLPAAFVIGLIVALFVRETHCRRKE
jgi:MFS family permease